MNPLQVGAVVGTLVAGSAWCVARAVQRAPRSIAAARRQLYGAAAGPIARRMQPSQDRSRRDRAVEALSNGAAGQWTARHFGNGLEMLELSVADVVSRILAASGLMLFIVLGAVSALMAVGMLPLSALWPALSVLLAALAGWSTIRDVASKIERRQRELRQAANDFVQLVAVGLTTDQSVEEAIRFALAVGTSGGFDSLRDSLHTAPQRGIPVWEALDEFGQRFGLRELCEFATSIERQGTQGVSIGDTVATMATGMRAKALDELEREADKANANLSGPTVGFVVTTIVFLAYPLAQRISDAFGG